jgi:hypothetical protein
MTDQFSSNVHALVNATKDHGATPPEPSDARHIRRLANPVATQRNNPFVNFTMPQLLAIDFAEATLAWLDDPTNKNEIARFRSTRLALLQALHDDPGD